MNIKQEFQDALIEAYPQRKGQFKWQSSVKTKPSWYWRIEEDGSLSIRFKKVASGVRKKDGEKFTSTPPKFFKQRIV